MEKPIAEENVVLRFEEQLSHAPLLVHECQGQFILMASCSSRWITKESVSLIKQLGVGFEDSWALVK
jgi:hypothetical protein